MVTCKDEFVDLPRSTHEKSLSYPKAYIPICFDKTHFLLSESDLEQLPEYSHSKPTGVFHGKCWKIRRGDDWLIACYIEEDPPHPDGMWTPRREALIV